MNSKTKVKVVVDSLMCILLLLLMGFQVTGQELHEWLGTGMLLLFAAHNILNFKWYNNLPKGSYTGLRAIQTVVNGAMLIFAACLAYSGIIMSGYVFDFLPISGGMGLARQMHMTAGYWGFVLMSIHLGLHWLVVMGIARKAAKGSKVQGGILQLLRAVVLIGVVYGAICFFQADLVSYLFLKKQFVFFDFQKGNFQVFAEYGAIMSLWAAVGHYGRRILSGRIGSAENHS